MGYEIAYMVEYLLRLASRHRGMALGALALFVLMILYNVMQRQYEPRGNRDATNEITGHQKFQN